MSRSQWHKFYRSRVAAPADVLFDLLADLPEYRRWLPGSEQFGRTTDVEPYPVRLGSRYHDGRPDGSGRDWWGTVTGYQPPGCLDFQHTIRVAPLRALRRLIIKAFDQENVRTMAALKRYAEERPGR